MSDKNSAYINDIGGNVKGIIGDVKGGVVNQYIIASKSETEIHNSQRLIKGSPYLGLNKFEPEDKDKFFGRELWINELSYHLKQNNLLVLLGASGSGKSSLIQAGIIPYLSDEWGASKLVKSIFVPYENPFESFYNSLPSKYKNLVIEPINPENGNGLIKLIGDLKGNSHQWIIFIDQFEEIFTSTPKLKRDQFIADLVSLMEKEDDSIKLTIAMRSDFLDNLREYGDFTSKVEGQIRLIRDMKEFELRLAIAEPAARNGVTFEKGLVEQIINDFYQQAGSLPLLQFTLDKLWENNSLSDDKRVLTIKTYDDLGGVSGALQQQADYIYNEKLNDEEKQATQEIFIELIDLAVKEPVSRRVKKAQFINTPIRESALNKLIESRLLVSGRDESNTVEVAHEELIRSWEFIQNLIREQEEIIILRSRLIGDANQWNELRKKNQEKAKDELWSGSKLERVLELIDEESFGSLDKKSDQFIQASVEKRDRQAREEKARREKELEQERKARQAAQKFTKTLIGALFVTLGLTGLALQQWQKTSIEEINTITTSVETYLVSNQEFEALLASMRAGKKVQNTFGVDFETRIKVIGALQNSFSRVREFNRFSGHQGLVWDVSFSPDGRMIASASYDDTIKLWNLKGELLQTFTGHNNAVNNVNFSPDGQIIASASFDNTIKLWNLKGELLQTLKGKTNGITSVSFSPNGQVIAFVGEDKKIKLWHLKDKLLQTFTGHNDIDNVSFSPDGQMIAAAGDDHTVKLWNLKGKLLQTFKEYSNNTELGNSIDFSPDGQMIAFVGNDNTIKLWNLKGELLQTFTGHNDAVNNVSFSPDGQMIASASDDHTVKLWNLKGKLLQTLTGHNSIVNNASFSPDGQIIASASNDNTVKLWNLKEQLSLSLKNKESSTADGNKFSLNPNREMIASFGSGDKIQLWNLKGDLLQTLIGHNDAVNNVSFSSDGQMIASVSDDNTVKLWNLKGKLFQSINDYRYNYNFEKSLELAFSGSTISMWKLFNLRVVKNFSLSADSKTIAFVSNNNTIKVWNLEQKKLISTLVGHEDTVRNINFSPDGKNIISASLDNTVKLWSLKGELLVVIKGYNASFSPDGKIIASSNNDGIIRLWNFNGEQIATIEGDKFFFSFNGKIIATAKENKTIELWNSNGELITVLRGHTDFVNSISFSPNGQLIVSGSEDNTIKLWNFKGQLLQTLREHTDDVNSVSFDSDGKTIISSSNDQTIKLWSLDIDRLMIKGCNWISDYTENKSNFIENDQHLCEGIKIESSKINQKKQSLEHIDVKEEIAAFSRVIELEPKNAEAYIRRYQAYYFLEDYKKALNDLSQAIKLKPKVIDNYGMRGIVYQKLKNYPKALSDYKQALAIDDKFFLALNNIGLINYEIGNKQAAFKQWLEAEKINQKIQKSLQQEQESLQQRTQEYIRSQEINLVQDSIELFSIRDRMQEISRLKIKLKTNSAESSLAIAVTLYTQDDREKGLELAEKAVKQNEKLGSLEFLKDNLWGEKLLADTQELFETEKIKAIISPNSAVLEKQ